VAGSVSPSSFGRGIACTVAARKYVVTPRAVTMRNAVPVQANRIAFSSRSRRSGHKRHSSMTEKAARWIGEPRKNHNRRPRWRTIQEEDFRPPESGSMTADSPGSLLQRIRQLVGLPPDAEVTDSQLLKRYVLHHEGDAFGLLLHRHGPMVLGLCRRLIR